MWSRIVLGLNKCGTISRWRESEPVLPRGGCDSVCVAVVPYIFAEFGVVVWVEGEGDDSGDAKIRDQCVVGADWEAQGDDCAGGAANRAGNLKDGWKLEDGDMGILGMRRRRTRRTRWRFDCNNEWVETWRINMKFWANLRD